ncbi:MAG: energy transducer TonB [Terriglobia bacterium]
MGGIRLVKSFGYGMDEAAVRVIAQWRFKPALRNGKPVRVVMQVETYFRLF